jgi:predicted amidohydrolase
MLACLRVAAVQLHSTPDRAANLASADRHTRAAAAAGAQLIVLPEKWPALGPEEAVRGAAETLDGPALTWARSIARELAVELVAGSILERVEGQEKFANTSVHIDRDGEIRALYRKIHMFDVDLAGRAYRESDLEDPGEEIVLSHTADGTALGLAVCYDLRFPELFRILAVQGAEVIALPAAFTRPTTLAHWEILLRARAIENQCYMVAANQTGAHGGGLESGGLSMIVDPWGEVLARASEGEGHVLAEVSPERLREVRARLPSLANRQARAYRWPEEARAL